MANSAINEVMLRYIFLTLLCTILSPIVWSQNLLHQPLVGGVTHNSARLFVWSADSSEVTVRYTLEPSNWNQTNILTLKPGKDNAVTFDLTNLLSDTTYFYKVKIKDSETGVQRFKTFPSPSYKGYLNFAFGSCQSFRSLPPNEPVFDIIKRYEPRIFLQCGDWGYPDTTDKYPQDSNFFALDYQRVLESYHARYWGGQIQQLFSTTPIDYVYDDHDYVNDNSSALSSSIYGNKFTEVPFSPIARRNIIDAYHHLFPHYNLPDTSKGIYHTIRMGNAEFFVCDNRADRSPNLNSLKNSGNDIYVFDPPAGHSILGETQMQWLLNGLKNSTAQWKFIVTGVSFNKGYKKVIDAISGNAAIQNFSFPGLDFSPKSLLGSVVDTWAGFPQDQDRLIQFTKDNNIKNVIFLTSDSHTSAMDDGTNAGLPEVMAGNLAQTNSRLAWIMANARTLPIIGNLINADLSAWNGGGQGLGNNNFNNAFGNIEIFGDDSVRCRLIDERGAVIATMVICADGKPCKSTSRPANSPQNTLLLYPNPAQNILNITLTDKQYINPQTIIYVTDVLGKKVKTVIPTSDHVTVNLQDLTAGLYYVMIVSEKGNFVKSFTKE